MIPNFVEDSFKKLEAYCRAEGYKGWDPYDGLNSRLFQSIPIIKDVSAARLIFIQLIKRSPLNLRRPLLIVKDYNPKGLALFLSGYCNLYRADKNPDVLDTIKFLADKLIELRSNGFSGSCWGYNFDWQARAFFQPRFTPTVVATAYAGGALLDAYEILPDARFLETACDAKNFILKDLNRTHDAAGDFAFSYSPLDETQIYNASLLGTRLLSRIYFHTNKTELIEAARRSAAFCCKNQRADGSWSYGTLPFHSWIDNFHTGYNLECLETYRRISGDADFDEALKKGFDFYIENFFTQDGIPKYYDRAVFPIDPHNTAQFVITLSRLGRFEEYRATIDKVLRWTIDNMQNEKGYFYYQRTARFTNRIPYIRWTQAWMFYALTEYIKQIKQPIV